MALSKLTQTVFNAPYGLDPGAQRITVRGTMVFSGASGTYATGGLLPNWTPSSSIRAEQQDQSGQNVLVGKYTHGAVFQIQDYAVASNVVTITAAGVSSSTLAALQWVTFNGLTGLPALNGLTLQVVAVSTGSFTVDFTTANHSTAAETGTAAIVTGPDEMKVFSTSGSGFIYSYNKANATVQVFTTGTASGDALNELAASTTPAGVTGDVIEFEASYVKG